VRPEGLEPPAQRSAFLDWYGAESMCSRGHGLLPAPEISASYSGRRHALRVTSNATTQESAESRLRGAPRYRENRTDPPVIEVVREAEGVSETAQSIVRCSFRLRT
jgi:hypothetical protein